MSLAEHNPPRSDLLSTRDEPSPLSEIERRGLIAISVLAVISSIATFSLLCFISYRLISWSGGNYKRYLGDNQYVLLIYNLLLADLQQSLAFLICAYWIVHDAIRAHTPACFLQGLWLQVGDPGSGLFVLAIAVHTFILVRSGRKPEHRWFLTAVGGVWLFLAVLVIVPLASHGTGVFVPSGAWCWINESYESDRLWTHYLWIFLAEFGTLLLYTIMFINLRRQMAASTILGSLHAENLRRLRRVVSYMVIYPLAYVVLSLPLAAGRMATARGSTPSIAYFCMSGAMMTSSGFVDAIMYTFTRQNLLLESEPRRDRYNRCQRNHHHHPQTQLTTIITAIGSPNSDSPKAGWKLNPFRGCTTGNSNRFRADRQDNSTEHAVLGEDMVSLPPMGKVYQKTTIEIRHEPVSELSGRDLPDHDCYHCRYYHDYDYDLSSSAERMWGK
ncbi:hypothetical protein VTN96DRAFT_5056 [Rasamsonia emersonii]